MKFKKILTVVFVLIFALFFQAFSANKNLDNNAVVYIKVYNSRNNLIHTGDGFLISSDGLIASKYSIIDKGVKAVISTKDGKSYNVKGVENYDKGRNIAILKIDNSGVLPYIKLNSSNIIYRGKVVLPINSVETLVKTKGKCKTLDEVKCENYPALPYDQLSKYLIDNYSKCELNGIRFGIDNIEIANDNADSKILYVLFMMGGDNYSNLLKAVSDKSHSYNYNLGTLENYLMCMANEVSLRYSNKIVKGGLFYIDDFVDKPSIYKASEIEYENDTKMWHLVHDVVSFSNVSGNFEFNVM